MEPICGSATGALADRGLMLNEHEQELYPPDEEDRSQDIPMTASHKKVLTLNRSVLVENMVPTDMFRHLVAKGTLTSPEERRVRAKSAWENINSDLLDHIVRKADSAFTNLEVALRDTCQGHLAELLVETGEKTHGEIMTADHKQAIYRHRVTLTSDMTPDEVFNDLIAEHVLQVSEVARIQEEPTRESTNEKLLDHVVRRSDQAFHVLTRSLTNTGQEHLARLLTHHRLEQQRKKLKVLDIPPVGEIVEDVQLSRTSSSNPSEVLAASRLQDNFPSTLPSTASLPLEDRCSSQRPIKRPHGDDSHPNTPNYVALEVHLPSNCHTDVTSIQSSDVTHVTSVQSSDVTHVTSVQSSSSLSAGSLWSRPNQEIDVGPPCVSTANLTKSMFGCQFPVSEVGYTQTTPTSNTLMSPATRQHHDISTNCPASRQHHEVCYPATSIQQASSSCLPSDAKSLHLPVGAGHGPPSAVSQFIRQKLLSSQEAVSAGVPSLGVQLTPGETCTLQDVKQQIVLMAENAYANIKRVDNSEEAFGQFSKEMAQTTQSINESLEVFRMIKEFCEESQDEERSSAATMATEMS